MRAQQPWRGFSILFTEEENRAFPHHSRGFSGEVFGEGGKQIGYVEASLVETAAIDSGSLRDAARRLRLRRFVYLEAVNLAAEGRGFGLGAWVAHETARQALARGYRWAILEPCPIDEGAHRGSQARFAAAVAKLQRHWGSLGFRFVPGQTVWMAARCRDLRRPDEQKGRAA